MPDLNDSTATELDAGHLDTGRLEAAHVGHVFRQLTDEHVAEKRRDDPEATWRAIEVRMRQDVRAREQLGRGAWGSSGARVAFVAAAAAVCLAAGGAGWLLFGGAATSGQQAAVLYYDVGSGEWKDGDGTPADEQHLVRGPGAGLSELLATEGESKFVRFSDTSVIELQPYTTLRVSVLDSGRVVTRLMRGSLEVNVHHQERTDYRFQAGDYEVKVVGTAFDLAFEPEPARFDLNLREGRVIVADGTGKTRVVQAGQALHLPTGTPSDTSTSTSLAALEDDASDRAESATGSHQPSSSSTAFPSYRELARRGQFQAIVTSARHTGIDHVLAAKGPSELHELAQAARYTGQVALAEKVFTHLASHHARSAEGRSAAFFRGRLAEDSGRLGQAQQHYHAYLAQGGGTYAAEALGRELTLVQKSKGSSAARPLAVEYLKRFPRGAYRDLAQALAQGSSAPR